MAEDYPTETTRTEKTNVDKTRPPVSALRYETPFELYAAMPAIKDLTQHRPREDEEALSFLRRLRSTTTPEEAVTYAAFAARPKMSIWWCYECLRTMPEELTNEDRALLELIAVWTTNPETENRYTVMKASLFAPRRTPSVLLGLAVGWSGNQIAPNDPAPVAPHRTPRAISSSVLSCLAKSNLQRRPIHLARFIDLAEALFKVY
jgi:hypothetical protein